MRHGSSPEGRPTFNQAADEGLVVGQEFRCAKEGLCTMEDASQQLAMEANFGWVVQESPRKIIGLSKKDYSL